MDYLEPMTAAVRAAANIYRSAKNDLHIEVKGEDKNNLVTAYDKQIQDFLYKKLSAAFPGCAFLGEEGGGKMKYPWAFALSSTLSTAPPILSGILSTVPSALVWQ